MTRCESSKERIYNFFEEIDRYIKAENSADSTTPPLKTSTECNSFSNVPYNSENPSLAKEICEKFVKRYKSLNPTLTVSRDDSNYINNWAFLNYWLNNELNKNTFYKNMCVKNFFNYMESYIREVLNYGFFISVEIFDINKEELDKMHILFNLYSNFHQIISEDKIICKENASCLDYYRKCVQEYKNGIIMCPNYEKGFCKELEKFQAKYEKLRNPELRSNIFNPDDIKPLPSRADALKEFNSRFNIWSNLTTVITTIFGSIFGLILILYCLYKFTPFGKWLPISKKKNQGKKNIMNEKIYNYIDNSIETSTYKEYTPYRVGYNST